MTKNTTYMYMKTWVISRISEALIENIKDSESAKWRSALKTAYKDKDHIWNDPIHKNTVSH